MFVLLFHCFLLCFGSSSARESVLTSRGTSSRSSRTAHALLQSGVEDCSLEESQVAEWYRQRDATWTITEEVLEAADSDLQRIVHCTNDNDTLLFEVSSLIQPRSEILVEKRLTFKGQTDSKVRFTCPTGEGVFRISDAVVRLEDVVIRDCVFGEEDVNRTAVLITGCDASLTLQDVVFKNNEHVMTPSILWMETSSCSSITMNGVRIRGNGCSGSCLSLTGNVKISNVLMKDNRNSGIEGISTLVSIRDSQDSEIQDVRFRNNSVRSFTIEDSSFVMSDSVFVDNEVDVAMRSRGTSGAVLFILASTGTIQSCRFERNRNPVGGGSAVLNTQGGSNLTVSDSVFIENRASASAGVLRAGAFTSTATTNVSFVGNFGGQAAGVLSLFAANFSGSGVIFEGNMGDGSGAVSFSQGSSFLCQGCLFKNNSGTDRGGALHGVPSNSPRFAAQLEDCEFISNTADVGGALFLQGRRFTSDFAYNSIDDLSSLYVLINCTFHNNTARIDGGAIFAQDPPSMRVQCSPREIPVEEKLDFISVKEFERLELIDSSNTCESWTDNQAAEGLVGQTVASYAQKLILRINGTDSISEENLQINDIVSGEALPVIEVIAVDHNDRGPSVFLSHRDSNVVTINSVDGIVDETQAPLENGRAVFPDISTLELYPAGMYTLEASVNASFSPTVSFDVEIVDG